MTKPLGNHSPSLLIKRYVPWLALLAVLALAAWPRPAAAPAPAATAAPTPQPQADAALLAALNAAGEAESGAVQFFESVRYRVSQQMAVVNEGPGMASKQNLWIALIQTRWPYQQVHSVAITPGEYQLARDEYGNLYAEFDFSQIQPGERIEVRLEYEVEVRRVAFDLGACQGELPSENTRAELHIEANNPQIQALSAELAAGKATACEQARAFYDYVGENLLYTFNAGNWGAQAALGEMGSDCTEYASLFVALSRAAGIPARYFEGLRYGAGEGEPVEHAWAEFYAPGTGWTPADATLGRHEHSRTQYFARLPASHIIVTEGRSPSTLRGGSYIAHLYWAAGQARLRVVDFAWGMKPLH